MPPAASLLRQALSNPRAIASVVPSGQFLSSAMARALPSGTISVVELGPGTGPVTQALLDSGIAANRLLAVEHNRPLGLALRRKFPHVPTAIADARFLPFILRDSKWPPQVDAIVSSLGLRALPPQSVEEIIRNANVCLRIGGVFIQFSYRTSSPVPPELCSRLGWKAEPFERVWRNLPPATVWRYTKL